MPEQHPLLVLLLPTRLEAFERRELAEELLAAPRVAAAEPPRVSYQRLSRLPRPMAAWIGFNQAKRMRLPGVPKAVALFDALQYPLARGMIVRHKGCELWYADQPPPGGAGGVESRAGEMHWLARDRAALNFEGAEDMWRRMRMLGIA